MPKAQREIPGRVIRLVQGTPEIDLKARTVKARIMTKSLARDGGIIIPDGIITRFYEQNPVVLAQHGYSGEARSPVIGKSLGLTLVDVGMDSVTQFADTELGREYGYLYGLNEKKEVFMRAWSFGWRSLETAWWDVQRAMTYLGALWDKATAEGIDQVWVSVKSEMHEYSAVAVGADREALSRAFSDGVRTAGEIISGLDLNEAQKRISEVEKTQGEVRSIVERLAQDIQALRRDGAAAAARGDSAEILNQVRAMVELTKKR